MRAPALPGADGDCPNSPRCTSRHPCRPPLAHPHPRHTCSTLASKLHLTVADAESWLIELIRQAQLDARIDSTERQVVVSSAPPSVYNQVIERTRDLAMRTRLLADSIETAIAEGGGASAGKGPSQRA